jgi:CRP-like cAMP-binding protein
MMEGPKRIYLFPGIASGYESRTFPDEIEYTRADLADALAEAAEEVLKELEDAHHQDIVSSRTTKALEAALAAYRDED